MTSALLVTSCGAAKHQHTWDNKWSFNETQHWVVATCHPNVCDHLANHIDINNDGRCDTCGYSMTSPSGHAHTWDTKWSTNSTQHWVVATCHPDVVNYLGNHVDSNNDGYCDTCGYKMPGTNTGSETKPTTTTIPSHTLKDTYKPLNINTPGQQVDEDKWEDYRLYIGIDNNYNYTYVAYTSGIYTVEKFTKDGYLASNNYGNTYYERKNGNTFYVYAAITGEGYKRTETTLDIKDKYVSRLKNEIYTHMFDYSLYEWNDAEENYQYFGSSFTATVKFQAGYLTQLTYNSSFGTFSLNNTFETEIEIPQSISYN